MVGAEALKSGGKTAGWAAASAIFTGWGLCRRLTGARRAVRVADARSILVIRLDLLGDLVFTLPAIRAIRSAAPNARVTLLALPYTASLVQGIDYVDRVVAVDVNRWRRPSAWTGGGAASKFRAAVAKLRGERFDLAISFYGRVGASAALLSGARWLEGYRSEGYPLSFDVAMAGARYQSGCHETEYCLDLARALGAPGEVEPPFLRPTEAASERVAALLAEAGLSQGDRIVTLHAGALNMGAKRWLPERWAEVADRIRKETACRVVLAGSGAEAELVAAVRGGMSTAPVDLCGRTAIPELIALIARSSLFLGGDSGPLHLAWALNVPSVAVYGPTDPALTGPLGDRATVLRGSADCMPCYHARNARSCLRGDQLCMRQVSAEDVYAAARAALNPPEGGE